MAGRAGRGNTGLVGAMADFFLELDLPRWTTVQVSHETDLVLGQSDRVGMRCARSLNVW